MGTKSADHLRPLRVLLIGVGGIVAGCFALLTAAMTVGMLIDESFFDRCVDFIHGK